MRLMEEYGQERYDEGYEKGIKKGYAEGANNEKWKIARSLLARFHKPQSYCWTSMIQEQHSQALYQLVMKC